MEEKAKSSDAPAEQEPATSSDKEAVKSIAATIKTTPISEGFPVAAFQCPEKLKNEGYDIKEQIGEGGFSTVFKASGPDPKNKDKTITMACKVINFANVPPAWKSAALTNELKISRNLKHDNVIYVYHIMKTKNNAYIFMELAKNSVSGYMINDVKRELSSGRTQFWFAQTMTAVQYMCLKGVAHRDLKTDNLLLVENEKGHLHVKLADFSFACYVKDRTTKKIKLTTTECGTREYKAPEIYLGKPYDPRISDMWSCGIILFEMLTMKNPFPFTDSRFADKDFLEVAKNKAWKFPKSVEHKIPIEAKNLTYKLLEANPDKRYTASQALAHPFLCRNK